MTNHRGLFRLGFESLTIGIYCDFGAWDLRFFFDWAQDKLFA
jgi:hypothetical protein